MDVLLTKSIQNHWLFQDGEKLKWWIDLHFLADEKGVISKSLSDLAYRWQVDKSTVSRFLRKMTDATLLQHSVQRITILKPMSYGGGCNTLCNESATPQEDPLISLSPTPPISFNPQEYNNLNLRTRTHTRTCEERISYEETREKAYKERFMAQGCGMKVSRLTKKNPQEILTGLDDFLAKCELGDFGHKDFGHFNNHFMQFIKNPDNSISNGNNNRTSDRRGSAGVSSAQDIIEPF